MLQKSKFDKNDNINDHLQINYIGKIKYKKLVKSILSMTWPYLVQEQVVSVDKTIYFLIKFNNKEIIIGLKNKIEV